MTVPQICEELDKLSAVDRMRVLSALAYTEAKRRVAAENTPLRFMQEGFYHRQPVTIVVLAGKDSAAEARKIAELLKLKLT